MKKISIGILICVVSIVLSSSASSFIALPTDFPVSIDPVDEIKMPYEFARPLQPLPDTQPFYDSESLRVIGDRDDIVIAIIQALDEPLYLSFLEDLVAFGPRVTGTSACTQAGTYIYNEFDAMGLQVRYDPWTNGGYSGNNIEGTLEGTNESSDDIYIVCAHYDSVSGSPGADDDGSGVAIVMAAAYILKDYAPQHDIRFVAFSGEEQGLLGSEMYAYECSQNGDDIQGVLNVDMIGFAITANDGNNIKIYENTASEWLYDFTVDVSIEYQPYILLNLIHSGSSSGSDHYYFWYYGYSAIFYHEYNFNDYYHSSGDTIAHMNLTYAVKSSKLILATLAELADVSAQSDPPSTPVITGPTFGIIGESYMYEVVATDPNDDDVYYYIDWDDGTNTGWVGPYDSGLTLQFYHTWSTADEYGVLVRAKDVYHATSDWQDPYMVTIIENEAPNRPSVMGPTKAKVRVPIEYTVQTSDPNNDNISYLIDWGDGTNTDWLPMTESGTELTVEHTWTKWGTYTVRSKAKDTYGLESEWGTIQVQLPKSFIYNIPPDGLFASLFPRLYTILSNIIENAGA